MLSPVDTLRAVSGRQTYALRSGLQVDSLGSVAIHCRESDALFGVAPLG
ncbi:MAG: DM13 domain-containing protein [Salinivenus sp.]